MHLTGKETTQCSMHCNLVERLPFELEGVVAEGLARALAYTTLGHQATAPKPWSQRLRWPNISSFLPSAQFVSTTRPILDCLDQASF